MTASTSKKVVVYRYEREPLPGYVNPQTWLQEQALELLSQDGVLLLAPYSEVKLVCFVKEFDGARPDQEKRLFQARPKTEGLWVRAQFRDNQFLEGVLPNNLLGFHPAGYMIAPPDPAANNQRIFLPRVALREFRVLGVVGAGRRRAAPEERQIRLFDE